MINPNSPLAKHIEATKAAKEAAANASSSFRDRLRIEADAYGGLRIIEPNRGDGENAIHISDEVGAWLARQLSRILGLDA